MEIPEGRLGSHTPCCPARTRSYSKIAPVVASGETARSRCLRPFRRAERERRNLHAFTTIELTLALTLVAIMTGLVMQFLLTSAHGATNLRSSTSIQISGQAGLDMMAQDIQGSDLCLSQYTNGSTVYGSTTTTSLVLRTPALNTGGTGVTTSEDHIIYQLVAYDGGGAQRPYTLNRTVVPASGSGRTAVNNQIVATNITSASFTYIAAQTQAQNALGSLSLFALLDGALYAAPVGSIAVQQAIVGGVDQCSGSSTCFSGGSLTLSTLITANAPMDLRFSVDPSVSVSLSILSACGVTCPTSESANFAKEVTITLKTAATSGSGNSVSAPVPTATFTTTASLRNKIAF